VLGAVVPVGPDKRAAGVIPAPDLGPHGCRHVATGRGRCRAANGARLCRALLPSFALPEGAADALVQDLLQVAIGDLVAEGRSDGFEIGDELAADGHAQDAKLVGDRFDAWRAEWRGGQCRPGTGQRGRGRLRFRESAKEIHRCRAGTQGGHDLADLFFGAAGGAVQDLEQTIFLKDVAQLYQRRQAGPAVTEVGENDWKACDQPSGGGPAKRGAPRVPEMLDQKRERRREAELEVELSAIELGQVSQELDEERTFLFAKLIQPSGECMRRKLVEVSHASLVTDDFRTSPDATSGSVRHILDGGSSASSVDIPARRSDQRCGSRGHARTQSPVSVENAQNRVKEKIDSVKIDRFQKKR
jgi:hypothetical protein